MLYFLTGRRRKGLWICLLIFCSWVSSVLGNTYLVINTNDSGAGSLRQAILDANGNSGFDTISFLIPGTGPFTINLLSTLPSITDPVAIDATAQPGYLGIPRIELNGSGIGSNGDGLQLLAGGCTVRGLAINRCQRDGIRIQGLGTNVIQGNYLGTDLTGTLSRGNAEAGVYIFQSSGNLIGGTNAAARNVISGGNLGGIYLDGAASNSIQGNFIGTSAAGATALGNANNGIVISASPQNIIGGASGAGNVISANGQSGIYLINVGTTGNLIQGNFIGTDSSGSSALGNADDGVTIYGVSGNVIGGSISGAGNLISGNKDRGVFIVISGATNNFVQGNLIGTDITGKIALANRTNGIAIIGVSGNTVGGTNVASRNIVSGNGESGILIIQSGATNNFVEGNFIGVDTTGTNALANTFSGVTLDGVAGNLIGGTITGARNIISGNNQNGIFLTDGGGANFIQGDFIGTDFTGKIAIGNSLAGIRIETAGNTIGGTTVTARNVISGNSNSGIFIFGAGATNNLVEGNFIGTDIAGIFSLGNIFSGINLSNAPANIIGGASFGAFNVISGNQDSGVSLQGKGTARNSIQGNYIGTDATGDNAVGNALGGIYFYGAPSNTVGGAISGAGNLISGNWQEGISIGDPGANYNTIQGNFIGTKTDGVSPLGNQLHNIDFLNTASNNLVGGTTLLADNRIAFAQTAGYDGIRIRDGCTGNLISRNSIFSNGASSVNGLGIDIGVDGVSTTNLCVLTAAVSGTATAVRGSLTSAASKTFMLQFYANVVTNISGYGEGFIYLGSTNVTTDASGHATFTATFAATISAGHFISATTTDAGNNTSEFSADVLITSPPFLSVSNSASQLALAWPTNPAGFVLQTTTNLAPPAIWSSVTNVPLVVKGENQTSFAATNGNSRFYRLIFQ